MDVLGMSESSALPVERMSTLLRHMLDCILDKQRHDLVRGNARQLTPSRNAAIFAIVISFSTVGFSVRLLAFAIESRGPNDTLSYQQQRQTHPELGIEFA